MKKTNQRREHEGRELTSQQRDAIALLGNGKTDHEAADELHLHADTITRWRMYDPIFQAALNRYRADVGRAAFDRFRAMVPQAIDALADELQRADNPDRCRLALDVLRMVRLFEMTPQGPQEPEVIVRQAIEQERQQARTLSDDLVDSHRGLPAYEDHLVRKWSELEAKAAETPKD